MKRKIIMAAIVGGAVILLSFSGCSSESTSRPVEDNTTSKTSFTTIGSQSSTTESSQPTTTTASSAQETETTMTTQATKAPTTAEKTTIPTKSTVTKATTTTTNTRTTNIQSFVPKTFAPLSMEKYQEISACIEKDNYECGIGWYYGTYNQYDIMLITVKSELVLPATRKIKIAGFEFEIDFQDKLIAYQNNSYILLSDAYDRGLLDKEDIQNIHYLYSGNI